MQSPTDLNESDTDDSFMKRLILHNRSVSEDNMRPQAFSRAQVRPRHNRLTLANLERLPIPEPPQVTTKSDLGSIESQSSGERPRNRLEAIRQHEIDVEREDEDDLIDKLEDDLPTELPPPPPPPPPPAEPEPVAHAVQGDDGSDLSHIRKMSNHLRSLGSNIGDVKTGLDKITKLTRPTQNGSAAGEVPKSRLKDEEVYQAVKRAGLVHLWGYRWWIFLMLAMPLYVVLECIACMIWCRPVVGDSMKGFGTYPDAPELPFVIPTMLFRPFAPLWRPLLYILKPFGEWLAQFFMHLMGWEEKEYVLLV